jgi:hypothetical protein
MNKIRSPYNEIAYRVSMGWNDHLWKIPNELLESFGQEIAKECVKICQQNLDKETTIQLITQKFLDN